MSLNCHCNRWLLQALISPTRPALTPSRRICLWTASNPSYYNRNSNSQQPLRRSYSSPTSKRQPLESKSSTSASTSASHSPCSPSSPSRRPSPSSKAWAHSKSGGPSIEILTPTTAKPKSAGRKGKDKDNSGSGGRDRKPRHRSDDGDGQSTSRLSSRGNLRASNKNVPQDNGRFMSKEKRALFLPKNPETWQVQKKALTKKFEGGWNPRKKLSPDAVEGIRGLHAQDPEKYSTESLSEHFKVSAEAIRRILKSKWRPKDEAAMQERRERWARRHDRIWDQKSELGLRPKRTSNRRVERPDEFEENLKAEELLRSARQD
ncbi:hypothetical protein PV10_01607 [Exophiala mesophila]|uniref:Required for respiratory growth protein 9, mitochondrial n=1 Tax=Exophiala mesophila TaxID=212818 RepID=A0A0D1ZTK9_EXOME|nr:uncharacterized protein PV10_01607 [Exophiala mesophila]KIV97907.1 hypothetical protein PV10_01607 [Exophiala mesophila]